MILLDTHIWIWWVHGDARLDGRLAKRLEHEESRGLGISIISCWEVAKLVEHGRLELPYSVPEWFDQALNYPGVRLLELTPEIAFESTSLPGDFHRDPADQIIVATSRIHNIPLATADAKILAYDHVETLRLN
jgi:PIN domain nuclease of toxin-antitoxin system